MESERVNRVELVNRVNEIIQSSTRDPAKDLQAIGQAMVEMGKALEGLPASEARAVLRAVMELQ
jgi:hypothetical protein